MQGVSSSWRAMLDAAGAQWDAFGPAEFGVQMVQTFGFYEAEYAAIHRGVGLLDLPQRGVLRCTGKDRQDFLHRLLTQDIRAMTAGQTRRALQLNDKGRIVADLLVHHGSADTWLELDRFDLAALRTLLEPRLFTEEVVLEDFSAQRTCLALHGPAAQALLTAVAGSAAADLSNAPGTHHVLAIAGQPVTAYRWDDGPVPGIRLLVPSAATAEVAAALAAPLGGLTPESSPGSAQPHSDSGSTASDANFRGRGRGRGIGWLAFNTARVEAGTPWFHIDFGTDCLVHEVGRAFLEQTVSFKKGCYLGQEIVARMENLGHPKRVLVRLKCADDRLPLAGAQVLDAGGGDVVGGVTSSAVSPLRGNVALAMAMVKWGRHEPGTALQVPAEGAMVPAVVN